MASSASSSPGMEASADADCVHAELMNSPDAVPRRSHLAGFKLQLILQISLFLLTEPLNLMEFDRGIDGKVEIDLGKEIITKNLGLNLEIRWSMKFDRDHDRAGI